MVVGSDNLPEMVEKTMTVTEIILLISGISGAILGIYNAAVSAKKSTVEELHKLYVIEKEKRLELESKLNTLQEELRERDELIADLKDWIERLLRQFARHVPSVVPEEFIKHSLRKPYDA